MPAPPQQKFLLESDPGFQRWEWRIQRMSWVLWVGILAAAVAGLLGSGPLSWATATSADGRLSVRYDRFLHQSHTRELEVRFASVPDGAQTVGLRINQSYLDGVELKQIVPEPVRVEIDSLGQVFHFAVSPGVTSGTITFHFQSDCICVLDGRIEQLGGAAVAFRQLVYP